MDEVFEEYRPKLIGLAYRMLGSWQEAEDIVQDAYLRWSKAEDVQTPGAWLTKVVTNLCLNALSSARARREVYIGPWLPEPIFTDDDPAELRHTVSYALLTLMERLVPAERAVFILKEAFGYSHREIAGFLELTEANTRQLHSRARRRLGEHEVRFTPSPDEQRRLVERFLAAAAHGDMDGLTGLLAAEVMLWADGGGKASAALRPIIGRDRVVPFLLGVVRKAGSAEIRVVDLNGEVAVVLLSDGVLFAAALFEISAGAVTGLRTVLNPEKLRPLARRLSHL